MRAFVVAIAFANVGCAVLLPDRDYDLRANASDPPYVCHDEYSFFTQKNEYGARVRSVRAEEVCTPFSAAGVQGTRARWATNPNKPPGLPRYVSK